MQETPLITHILCSKPDIRTDSKQPIVYSVEAETEGGRLVLKVTPTAARELVVNLKHI